MMVRTFLCQPFSDPKVFSDEYEPTACCCTRNGLILIASGSGGIHVYSASGRSSCRIVSTLPSIGIANRLVCCHYGGYIAAIENKVHDTRAGGGNTKSFFNQVRIYCNWMAQISGKSSILLLQRVRYSSDALNLENFCGKFLALDVPVKYSVTDIACCDTNGNLVLSTEAKVFLYAYKQINVGQVHGEYYAADFECVIEIDAGFQINQVAVYGGNIVFASSNEVRAIQVTIDRKGSITQAEDVCEMIEEVHIKSDIQRKVAPHCSLCQSKTDENCLLWNIEQGYCQGLEGLEHETITVQRRKTASSSFGTPTYTIKKSNVKFESVNQDATYLDNGSSAKEILGPKESIKGHPLIVISNLQSMSGAGQDSAYIDVSHMTLLYRRFQTGLADAMCESLPLHSLQWLPIYADASMHTGMPSGSDSPISAEFTPTSIQKGKALASLGLFFSTARKGYLYDMLNTPRLLTEYDFTEDCISACLSRKMLNVITKNGLETYTTRLYPSAAMASHMIFGEEVMASPHNQDRERAWSSLSLSSGSEVDSKSQLSEGLIDFNEEEAFENTGYLNPTEGHYKRVLPEPRRNVGKELKTRFPFKRSKKKVLEKRDSRSPVEQLRVEEGSVVVERTGSFSLRLENAAKEASYSCYDLMQPCPPTDIEICLIAMYRLHGLTFIGATEMHTVLLQRAFEFKGKRGSLGKERIMPWNVYVREIVPATEVSREIMNLIEGSEFANPHVFHQLLSEAHMFLRADLTSVTPEERKDPLVAAIRRSAVKIGDFCSRCSASFDVSMAKKYYKVGGIKLEQILLRHSKRDDEENLFRKYGFGIIEYLNEEIFTGEGDSLNLPEGSVFHILKIYAVAAPHLLSKVILKSSLKNIRSEQAVLILEKFISTDAESSEYSLSSLDFITIAILRLRLCDPNHAEHVLKRLPDDQLVQAVTVYPEIMWQNEGLSHLGQLLKRHFFPAFSDILVVLFDKGLIELDKALSAFGIGNSDVSVGSKPNAKVCEFLETLLSDCKRKESFPEIMVHLLQQYTLWLEGKTPTNLLKIPHKHIPKGTGHFASRFEWLDKLPPFFGEVSLPQDCLLRKQHQAARSLQATPENSPSSSEKSSTASLEAKDMKQQCTCCCCNSILLKLHSLLCSPFCTSSTSDKLLRFMEDNQFIGEDAVKLLCYPASGEALKAVEFLVQNYPSITLQYGKDVFQSKRDQWKTVLDCLLKIIRDDLYERWNKETYLEALKGTLMKLARLCQPTDFITLLPNDGAARFFLPFIQDCYQMHCSVVMRLDILKTNEITSP